VVAKTTDLSPGTKGCPPKRFSVTPHGSDNLIHGQGMVVLRAIRNLGLVRRLEGGAGSRERNLVLAMIASQIIKQKR
jgi:hypothetical protein